MDMYTEV